MVGNGDTMIKNLNLILKLNEGDSKKSSLWHSMTSVLIECKGMNPCKFHCTSSFSKILQGLFVYLFACLFISAVSSLKPEWSFNEK